MVEIAQSAPSSPLPEVRFHNPRLAALGLEPMTLEQLRKRASLERLAAPQRVDLFILMLVTGGRGRHTVDFVDWPLAPGTLVFVRPGQVQQWHVEEDLAARLVLVDPATLPHRSDLALPRDLEILGLDEWPTATALDDEGLALVGAGLDRLWRDFDGFAGGDLDIALLRHELMVLLLRLAKLQRRRAEADAHPLARGRVYRLFLQALENDFQAHHHLAHYARRLGYSASTLSRACLAAEGRAAKEVIDRRIALEARRLLAHSSGSVAEIAYQLGFSEATNFVKFFRRLLGLTPLEFRRGIRGA